VTDLIVPRAHILAKAARDHAAGQSRDAHGFNWHAPCLPAYLAEFDRLAAAGKPSHKSHAAPAGQRRVELAQGV
jgi:hypothetical protein